MREHKIKIDITEDQFQKLKDLSAGWRCPPEIALKYVLFFYPDKASGPNLTDAWLGPLKDRHREFAKCVQEAKEASALEPQGDPAARSSAAQSLEAIAQQAMDLQSAVLKVVQLASIEELEELRKLLIWLPEMELRCREEAKIKPDQKAAHLQIARGIGLLARLLRQLGMTDNILQMAAEGRKIDYFTPKKKKPDTEPTSPKL